MPVVHPALYAQPDEFIRNWKRLSSGLPVEKIEADDGIALYHTLHRILASYGQVEQPGEHTGRAVPEDFDFETVSKEISEELNRAIQGLVTPSLTDAFARVTFTEDMRDNDLGRSVDVTIQGFSLTADVANRSGTCYRVPGERTTEQPEYSIDAVPHRLFRTCRMMLCLDGVQVELTERGRRDYISLGGVLSSSWPLTVTEGGDWIMSYRDKVVVTADFGKVFAALRRWHTDYVDADLPVHQLIPDNAIDADELRTLFNTKPSLTSCLVWRLSGALGGLARLNVLGRQLERLWGGL